MRNFAVIAAAVAVASAVAVLASPTPPPPTSSSSNENVELTMPDVKPQTPDTYLCRAMKVEDAHRYITGFVPKGDSNIAHHILLYACNEPGGPLDQVWNCGEMHSDQKSKEYPPGPVCAAENNIIYAWAMDAPALTLPEEVSFDVGQDTDMKYLVLQVHYKNVQPFLPPVNGVDNSGLTLVTSTTPTTKQAGVLLMLTDGYIPAHSIEYFETACDFTGDIEIVPFAYRTHAHALGRVVSGYRIREGEWKEIGRKDPRLPEMFYNVTNTGMTIKPGDILAARCTMENKLDHDVAIGNTQTDEMCNFYIMFYVNGGAIPSNRMCQTEGPPEWYWTDFDDQERINVKAEPDTVSVIPGEDHPLVRNATFSKNSAVVAGIPGRFEDSSADELVDEAIRDMNAEDLLYLVQQIAAEEEEERAREEFLWQQQQLRRLYDRYGMGAPQNQYRYI